MNGRDWGDVVAAFFVLALLTLLCRPNSQGSLLLASMGTTLETLINYAVAAA